MAQEQERFWKDLYLLKFQIVYVQMLVEQSEKIERRIQMFLAVASSASIGAWVVWTEFAFFWGAIIAASHVLAAIHPHLPYAERQGKYSLILRDFESLFMDAEHSWQKISVGKISLSKISELNIKLRVDKNNILNKYMSQEVFEGNGELTRRAEVGAGRYFSYHYSDSELDSIS